MNASRVVITGLGPIGATGIGKDDFWRGACAQETGLVKRKYNIDSIVSDQEFFMHEIRSFDINRFSIDKKKLEYIFRWKEGVVDRDLELMIAATELALEDAGLKKGSSFEDLSLLVIHENPCLEIFTNEMYTAFRDFSKESDSFSKIFDKTAITGYETQSFMMLFHLLRFFNIHNYSLVVNNACASGLYGIDLGADFIKTGKAKKVAIVAGDTPGLFKQLWFKKLNMYDETGVYKSFCVDSNGFVLGEGAICLILEDLESALERGAKIYAEYVSGGFSLESWGVTTPRIGDDCLVNAIRQAIGRGNMEVGDVDLVCAHGTGTNSSDYYEGRAIGDVFGNNVPVTTFKSYLGHTLGASSLLELSLLILSMQNNYALGIMNHVNFDKRLKLNFLSENVDLEVNSCLKLCNAFAGYNAAVLLKRFEYPSN